MHQSFRCPVIAGARCWRKWAFEDTLINEQGSLTIRGHYYAPEEVANVLNNYLSPGLRGKGWYDAWMGAAQRSVVETRIRTEPFLKSRLSSKRRR